MDIPDAVIDRMKAAPKGQKKAEGIKIAVESVQRLQKIEGVSGVHLMAIEWEELIGDLVKASGLHPRPEPIAA